MPRPPLQPEQRLVQSTFTLDRATLDALANLVESGHARSRSEAIRDAVAEYAKQFQGDTDKGA